MTRVWEIWANKKRGEGLLIRKYGEKEECHPPKGKQNKDSVFAHLYTLDQRVDL